MAEEERRSDAMAEVRRLYEEAESRTAQAFERAVSRPSFGELLAWMTENVVGMTKIATDVFDLMLRNLRLAGRQDVTRLARQLNRTEDKLELVLQEVERLEDELASGGSGNGRHRGSRRTNRTNARNRSAA
jgi:hypothetical protein